MKILTNKQTKAQIIVSNVVEASRYYIIDKDILKIRFLIGDVYLSKDEWELKNF